MPGVELVVEAVAKWQARRDELQMYADYYNGRHRLAFATEAFLSDFKQVLEEARENLMPGVVKAFSSKLTITGWDGANAAGADAVFTNSEMKKLQNLVHREAFRSGDAYALVWPNRRNEIKAWPKLALQFHVEYWPDDPSEVMWAAMIWTMTAADGKLYARVNVYQPGIVERWISARPIQESSEEGTTSTWPKKADGWETYNGGKLREEMLRSSFAGDQVPVVPFVFDADQLGGTGRSILKECIPLQDGLNKSVADMIVGSEFFVMPLRAVTKYIGKTVIDPQTGLPKEKELKIDPTVNRLLGLRGDSGLTQLDPPDASKIIAIQDAYAGKICRVVGLPPFYFNVSTGEPPSGASLRTLATRQTDIVSEAAQDFTPSWSKLMEIMGVPDVEPMWKDPAPVDQTEELAAALDRKELGYPLDINLRKLGEDTDAIKDILAADVLNQARAVQAQELAFRSMEQGRDPADITG